VDAEDTDVGATGQAAQGPSLVLLAVEAEADVEGIAGEEDITLTRMNQATGGKKHICWVFFLRRSENRSHLPNQQGFPDKPPTLK